MDNFDFDDDPPDGMQLPSPGALPVELSAEGMRANAKFEAQIKILKVLKLWSYISRNALTEQAGIPETTAQRHIDELIERKLVKNTKNGVVITDAGKQFLVDAALRPPPFTVSPPQMRRAMVHYAKGNTAQDSAERARIPLAALKIYLKQSNFGKELRTVVRGLVETTYAPRAFAFLDEVVRDAAMPARVRVNAAKIIIDRAGYVAAPPDAARDPKDLTTMTREELHKFVMEAEAKLSSEAKDVSPPDAARAAGEDESGRYPAAR